MSPIAPNSLRVDRVTVGEAFGRIGRSTVSSIGALPMTARATAHTRQGFDPRLS